VDDPCRKTHQNTARIARTAMNVVVCRTFLRAVLYPAIARKTVGSRPFLQVPPAYRVRRNVAICRHFCNTKGTAVDAVGIYYESLPVEGDRRNVPCGDFPNCLQKTPAAELQEGTRAARVRTRRSHLRATRRT
jgi:hypothetical protein